MTKPATPRTDAMTLDWQTKMPIEEGILVPAEFARQLERELAAVSSRVELLEHDMKSGDYEALYAQVVNELAETKLKLELAKQEIIELDNDITLTANALNQAEQRLAKAEKILDWLEENGTSNGGGNGFLFTVFVPVDCESFQDAILAAIAQEKR